MTAPEGWTLTRGIWRWTAAVSPEEYDHLNGRGDTTLDLGQLACACGASVTEICRTKNGNPAGPHRYRRIPRRCTCGSALAPRKHVCPTCRAKAEQRRYQRRDVRRDRARRAAA